MRRNLGGDGPIAAVDATLALLRRGGARLWLAPIAGGLSAVAPILLAFYFERVEGVDSLRPLLALGVVAGLVGRALLSAPAARAGIEGFWPTLPIPDGGGRAVDVVRTASVVYLALFGYLLVLFTAALITPVLSLLLVPMLSLRGLWAPSWMARAAISDEGGLSVFLRAASDTSGRRVRGAVIEAVLLVGTAGLAFNLYLTMVILLILLRSLLGMDMASVDAFLSLRNPIVGASIVGLAFVLFEPLRVGLSAFGYVDAQVRREGLDLAAAIDEAVSASERRRGAPKRTGPGMAAVVLLAALATPGAALAQEHVPSEAHGDAALQADEAVRDDVERILARREFMEIDSDQGRDLDALMRTLLAWLLEQSQSANPGFDSSLALPMPPTWFFIAVGSFLLLVVVAYLLVTRGTKRTKKKSRDGAKGQETDDPRERAPEAHLDDAALLAQGGRFREALRSLYLATLVALDRRRLITFDPSRTNWHYLRQLPRDSRRLDFSRFTQLFDHKWYGEEPTTEEDYRECRALADRIVATSGDA